MEHLTWFLSDEYEFSQVEKGHSRQNRWVKEGRGKGVNLCKSRECPLLTLSHGTEDLEEIGGWRDRTR